MSNGRHAVSVRVPASTSNCGAGIDSLGLALGLFNRVALSKTPGAVPHPERAVDARAQELVGESAAAFFIAAACAPFGFDYRIESDIPTARGLGSSATIIAGVLAGLDVLAGTGWPRHKLVEIATAIEGHPDNVSASILGGFTVSRCDPVTGIYLNTIRIVVPATLAFVVASPGIELQTKPSRGSLPASVPFFDAVKSINSAAYIAAVFATGELDKLRHAVGDFMHEPYRLPKIPGARPAIEAGMEAGALTGWLSGSGSSVLCVCRPEDADRVGASMCAAFWRESVPCEARVLAPDNTGLVVE